MATPISSFELVESIRFFASLVGTDGVSEVAKIKANDYIIRLLDALEPSVQEVTANASGLHLAR